MGMKKGDYVVTSVLKFFFLFLSVFVGSVVSALILRISTNVIGLFVEIPYWVSSLIRALLCTLISALLVFLCVRRVGFRRGEENRVTAIVSSIICCAIHLAAGLLFTFSPFWSGGVNYVAGLILFGRTFIDQNQVFAEGNLVFALVVALIFEIGYGSLMVWAEVNGVEARKKERLELTGNEAGVAPLIEAEDEQSDEDGEDTKGDGTDDPPEQ